MTLKEFYENGECLDGHYAVWKSEMIPNGSEILYGFSGIVIQYSQKSGFEDDYPEWMDSTHDSRINLVLLEEMPEIHEIKC